MYPRQFCRGLTAVYAISVCSCLVPPGIKTSEVYEDVLGGAGKVVC